MDLKSNHFPSPKNFKEALEFTNPASYNSGLIYQSLSQAIKDNSNKYIALKSLQVQNRDSEPQIQKVEFQVHEEHIAKEFGSDPSSDSEAIMENLMKIYHEEYNLANPDKKLSYEDFQTTLYFGGQFNMF